MSIEEIKAYMKKNKITYQMLAEMTGLSVSTVTKIFGGFAKYPRIDTVQAIERALGLGFTPEEEATGISPTARVTVTPDEDDILTLYREIGEKKGSETQELARRLLEQVLKA